MIHENTTTENTTTGPTEPRLRHAAASTLIGAVVIVAVVAVGIVVKVVLGGKPFSTDLAWAAVIGRDHFGFAGTIARALDLIGGPLVMIVIGLVITGILWLTRRRALALTLAIAMVSNELIVAVLKLLIARPRPLAASLPLTDYSFPSGHTAIAAATAITLALAFRRTWVWALACAWTLTMAVSRTYLAVHWASDVLAGIAIGVAVAVIATAGGQLARNSALRRNHTRLDQIRLDQIRLNRIRLDEDQAQSAVRTATRPLGVESD